MTPLLRRTFSSLLLVGLVACGGGGDEGDLSASGVALRQDVTSAEGLARFNEMRSQLQLPLLVRDTQLDRAAQVHSDYQALNNEITHDQTPGKQGYQEGWEQLAGRIAGSGYALNTPYAIGEVISRTRSKSGTNAANELVTAIYHRFVIFEPMFTEVGVGAAASGRDQTYFTTNFAAPGLKGGIGRGNFVTYPRDGQVNVPVNFFSDQEVPDPVCPKDVNGDCADRGRNEVGYPISVHADIFSPTLNRNVVIRVQNFTVRPVGGPILSVEPLWNSVDKRTPRSVAAIVPLEVLARNTTYEVQFTGTVDDIAANRTWTFTTAP